MMTSLFRRSASSNGSHGSREDNLGDGGSELNNGKPSRQVRRLEFNQAMDDFKIMFPSMDHEVIECVLRSNNGAVDSTIDQLLQMSLDGQGTDESSDSEDSIPAEILERTLEPDSSDEEPPPVYSPPSYEMHIYDRKYPADVPPFPPPRFDAHPPPSQRQVSGYRNWNPPLLGNLPDDFLRILPQQQDSLQRSQSSLSQPSSSSSSSLSSLTQYLASEHDRKLKQYRRDERIALFLQNEEFMMELQRNREFRIALERGDHSPGSDDAFRDKLKHMGKSTRKKLLEIAKSFSEKTRKRKSKKKPPLKHHSLATAASTANLLEDVEGFPGEDHGMLRRPGTQDKDESEKEVVS
ncbi:CUE domain-containing protein 1a isoform X2 [Trichomycterus rosablanca]|uniref:CUE domain-containing protein 1a isoform X2 n=1 Tax=Trichomycterus rosablanca TaxID=2290929 RepID=UPI002F350C59